MEKVTIFKSSFLFFSSSYMVYLRFEKVEFLTGGQEKRAWQRTIWAVQKGRVCNTQRLRKKGGPKSKFDHRKGARILTARGERYCPADLPLHTGSVRSDDIWILNKPSSFVEPHTRPGAKAEPDDDGGDRETDRLTDPVGATKCCRQMWARHTKWLCFKVADLRE